MHCHLTTSSNISDLGVIGLHAMALEFAIFDTSTYWWNRPMSAFSAPWSHYGSCDPTMLLSAYNSPKNLPTTIINPLCVTSWSDTLIKMHFLTTLLAIKLNMVGNMSPSWVVTWVALKVGPWYPFWRVTTSCWPQNIAISMHMRGMAPYPYSAVRKLLRYTVL